ncbi:ABC transporter permease [Ancylomarina euxinus]|uniref:ABC transporter permease n=1 Tax=Ancylomarina euxinus TaxID=2283627 RepID=A0A425Y1U3_9BACT|nr:ABC transporter permease [Ancylomarina euxinus]MCZ4695041.1 ABC transporter permease [Ancylomarina euxinus]MUP15023.1 ABC transporter permease subunit [Ancylomarina euxinus]RRG21910.1 ABC transporter permease [Ancylomarina euxinus]
MRTIKYILQKEFLQIFRNKSMLPIIFAMPIIQLCVLVFAATFEMKNTNVYVVDRDLSSHSRQIISKFYGSPFFTVKDVDFSIKNAEDELSKDNVDAILYFENGFGKAVDKKEHASVQVLVNAIDASAAGLYNAYILSVIQDYNLQVNSKIQSVDKNNTVLQVKNTYSYLFNAEMKYIPYMLPGILVLLITVIGLFLSAMNVVREKEIGTIEQINVTPIKRYQFLIGKLIPFLLIGFFELGVGLIIAAFVFKIPILGSVWLIYLVAFIYLLTILGIGLFISTQTDTQQQAMFIAWFFMIIFVLMGGLFTPTESMPEWGQKMNLLNPVAYFIKIIRMIMLKGSGFMDILKDLSILALYSLVMLSFAVNRYRKVA